MLEVIWDGLWTLSSGLSQLHGHGSCLVCEVALTYTIPERSSMGICSTRILSQLSENGLPDCHSSHAWNQSRPNLNHCGLYINLYVCVTVATRMSMNETAEFQRFLLFWQKEGQFPDEIILINYVPFGIVSIGGGYRHKVGRCYCVTFLNRTFIFDYVCGGEMRIKEQTPHRHVC